MPKLQLAHVTRKLLASVAPPREKGTLCASTKSLYSTPAVHHGMGHLPSNTLPMSRFQISYRSADGTAGRLSVLLLNAILCISLVRLMSRVCYSTDRTLRRMNVGTEQHHKMLFLLLPFAFFRLPLHYFSSSLSILSSSSNADMRIPTYSITGMACASGKSRSS